ncbi:hypothetical protein UC8_00480 [Roseimaritima ulvae]|uniref:Uncharacterized protein n=2 Tax=Roseimaritima ulvae TaxID=980254 RepID=A0A5B9QKM6_9BACT|nr:hypothetical protein UC8_00480 [Roseimaritima ulvae]
MFRNLWLPYKSPALLALICFAIPLTISGHAQDDPAEQEPAGASVQTSVAEDGRGTIVVEARGQLPEPPVFYSATAKASVQVGAERSEQTIALSIRIIQGEAETISFGIRGPGEVKSVESDEVLSWSVRRVGEERFLDLQVKADVQDLQPVVKLRSPARELPATVDVTHLSPADAVGFDSIIEINYAAEVQGTATVAEGFVPFEADRRANRFHTSSGGQITLSLNRSGAAPADVDLIDTKLTGDADTDGKSVHFQFSGTAIVSEPDVSITILSGNAAISELPADTPYRLRLSTAGERPVYELVFPQTGSFPIQLDFVAALNKPDANSYSLDFTVAAGAVVPMNISGLGDDLEFHRDPSTITPQREADNWLGFLPASGRAHMQWKAARKTGEGKLFFTTSGRIDASVGTGLLRQDHQIDYQVLQGELKSLSIRLNGPGEILDVQGSNLVAWNVVDKEGSRQLDITLSQPITGTAQINVRSQTPLGAFPVRVEGLRLNPIGAIRHSGYLRLSNRGSVRLDPTGLTGLTQLAPDQFPGDAVEARQVFVYRFPAAQHAFTVVADRIQPEVNISALVLYQLAETDRVIQADIEMDVREAPIREWDFGIPGDYSVVSVTGAAVADYIAASEITDGVRNLRVIFGQDVSGRQLVTLQLEKNEVAAAADWVLPRIEFTDAKTVRGNIGIVGAPGYRIAVAETDLLVETPLSYFPKPTPNLQQAFRIREPGWSATMRIEPLPRSVQSDVFHLYSLSQETVYGSALINYFVTGAPVSEWKITIPAGLGNLMVDGQDVRTWRRDGDTLIVSLHQPVMGPYTLLVTFEEKPDSDEGTFQAAAVTPLEVQGERGYIQVVSPMQVEINTVSISEDILKLDPLELPAEFRLLSTAPPLGTWQYTARPFDLKLSVDWFQPGTTVTQVVEFSEANSRVSKDGELVTEVLYYVKSRGQRTFRVQLPDDPVRLWEATVNGQPVTARQADDATLIPLPGGTDPNIPVEVKLRLGKPTVDESHPRLRLPTVSTPVLKTQWNISGDEKHVLVASGGTVTPPVPVLRPSGLDWLARRGGVGLLVIGLLVCFGLWGRKRSESVRALSLVSLGVAVLLSLWTAGVALAQTGSPAPLQLSLPVLAAGETVELVVHQMPWWQANLSWPGLTTALVGLAAIGLSFLTNQSRPRAAIRGLGILLVAVGVLLQHDGAPWFYALLALAILLLLLLPTMLQTTRDIRKRFREIAERRKKAAAAKPDDDGSENGGDAGVVTASIAVLALCLSAFTSNGWAEVPDGLKAANQITQQWQVTQQDARLLAEGTIRLTGRPGDRFLLLKAPAVLTNFEADGLRLSKTEIPGHGLCYILTIPQQPTESEGQGDSEQQGDGEDPEEAVIEDAVIKEAGNEAEADSEQEAGQDFEASFSYQLDAIRATESVPVLTGTAAMQTVQVSYDEAGWEITSPRAVRVEAMEAAEGSTEAKLLLFPGPANLVFKPQARDVTMEATQFFVEASNLYLPGPGVIDGRHRLHIRTSQGQVSELNVSVPQGLTVSAVSGPVGSWQFDADSGLLKLQIEPAQSQAFDVQVDTQRGLDPLPADVTLAPLKVVDADGQVGLLAIAFGPDAQGEKLEPVTDAENEDENDSKTLSAVNLGDFRKADQEAFLNEKQAVLHRVYRYGAEGGELALRVAPVDSEVRVFSKQALSLGDERVVLNVNFAAEITRAGLFQLTFPLPDGLEVESLSGDALHHWSELSEGDQRQIILHLNGKTIGAQNFSLVLAGPAPDEVGDWEIPRFVLNESTRQTGELVVRPTTGIRLRTVTRQNVSETDPRSLGGGAQGALAFRLLQRDWNLVLGIEKLDPWVTGQVLHETTLREGQTRSALLANFNVQNASIRSLQVVLPLTDEDVIKTLRATGNTVSDFVRTAPDSNTWEVQFKRRVVGNIQFRIEYERRGERVGNSEALSPADFPQARQLAYFFAVRAGGRLEIEHEPLSQGWQRADWSTVPQPLREAGNRTAPALTLRAVAPESTLTIQATRHSLADALKLRVAEGSLTTVLSPTGDQLTAVELQMEVIQRSSLIVGLPEGGELFSIFVNGESVHSIRQGGKANAWQFYILPGIDDRTAKVRFVYTVTGTQLRKLTLQSPQLNVPLENIQWHVLAPKGFVLTDNEGNLELIEVARQEQYDRDSYLSKVSGKRQVQAQQAAELLEQANELLQAGEQTKARWAFNSVANQYALDAASNEDARVQLENLQTQQAIVGLNTRRQRLFLDNKPEDAAMLDNEQLRQAAADNPILQQDQLNFRPQELSQLLRGNTTEDNAVLQQIAGRLVQHQHTTDPAPQAIIISLPEEGEMYTFRRSVQVAENDPLELELEFDSRYKLPPWQLGLLLVLLAVIAAAIARGTTKQEPAA